MFLSKQYLIRLKRSNKFSTEFKNRVEIEKFMSGLTSETGFSFRNILTGMKRILFISKPENEEFPQLKEIKEEGIVGEANCWIHVKQVVSMSDDTLEDRYFHPVAEPPDSPEEFCQLIKHTPGNSIHLLCLDLSYADCATIHIITWTKSGSEWKVKRQICMENATSKVPDLDWKSRSQARYGVSLALMAVIVPLDIITLPLQLFLFRKMVK